MKRAILFLLAQVILATPVVTAPTYHYSDKLPSWEDDSFNCESAYSNVSMEDEVPALRRCVRVI